MRKTYFALEKGDQLGKELVERWDAYVQYLRESGRWEQARRSHVANYGRSSNGGPARSDRVTRAGEAGELAAMKVNHFRNLAQHTLTLCTSQRPAPQPIATNSDSRTHQQVTLAHGLLDYYSREKRVERKLKAAAEAAILHSEGYIETEWDVQRGSVLTKVKDPVTGEDVTIREGDLKFSTLTLADVARDPVRDVQDEQDWLTTRHWVNRFELLARFPEYEAEILTIPHSDADDLRFSTGALSSRTGLQYLTDEIPVFRFFHRKTAAVPEGKLVQYLADGTVLSDTPLPYPTVPVRRICPAEELGTGYGYTPMFDLLVIQEAIDALYSIVLTNQSTFGVQTILVPAGHNLTYNQIARGLALLEYDSKLGKPEGLNLTFTPQEVFNFIRQLEEVMETLSGINSTVRGNPEASLKSGSALALVQSQAIQFSSGLQQSYAHLVEDVYTDALNILKAFAKTKRVVAIVGKHKRHMLRSFTGEDLDLVSRVVVDSGSALSKTASGRIQIAQDLLQNGLIKSPEQYLAVVMTGTLDPITEGDQAEMNLIREENEALSEGRQVGVTAIDKHRLHIEEHRAVLSSLDARDNPEVVQVAMEHIQAHITELKEADPALMALIGEQSLMLPPPTPEEAAGGTPPGGGPKLGADANKAAPQFGAHSALPSLAPPPLEPELPTNPLTGQRWNATDGGGMTVAIPTGGM